MRRICVRNPHLGIVLNTPALRCGASLGSLDAPQPSGPRWLLPTPCHCLRLRGTPHSALLSGFAPASCWLCTSVSHRAPAFLKTSRLSPPPNPVSLLDNNSISTPSQAWPRKCSLYRGSVRCTPLPDSSSSRAPPRARTKARRAAQTERELLRQGRPQQT